MPFLTKLYIFAKKIHRIVLYGTTLLILIMATTGTFMKFPRFASLFHADNGMMRYIHNQISPYFSVALLLMMLTGLYMYIHPILIKHHAKKEASKGPRNTEAPTPPLQ